MGREIRRVPPNWWHPIIREYGIDKGPQPMFDKTYEVAAEEWLRQLDLFRSDPEIQARAKEADCFYYWDWENGPPDKKYYRPWADAEATWFQAWETVTEGTPVSPPFATADELIHYLAERGDFWDQQRGDPGWGIEAAAAFVKSGWVPSGIFANGTLLTSRDAALFLEKDK